MYSVDQCADKRSQKVVGGDLPDLFSLDSNPDSKWMLIRSTFDCEYFWQLEGFGTKSSTVWFMPLTDLFG